MSQLPGRRSYRRFRPRPWRSVPCWPSPTACGHSQGVALPHRLSHAAGLFSPFTWLETIGGHYGPLFVLRPAGRDVEKYASLYTCGLLSMDHPDVFVWLDVAGVLSLRLANKQCCDALVLRRATPNVATFWDPCLYFYVMTECGYVRRPVKTFVDSLHSREASARTTPQTHWSRTLQFGRTFTDKCVGSGASRLAWTLPHGHAIKPKWSLSSVVVEWRLFSAVHLFVSNSRNSCSVFIGVS